MIRMIPSKLPTILLGPADTNTQYQFTVKHSIHFSTNYMHTFSAQSYSYYGY